MPTKMTSQKLQTGVHSRMPQSSYVPDSSRNDDASVGVPETPTRRTLQKKPPANPAPGSQTHFRTPSTRNTSDTRSSGTTKRRLSTRERSSTLGSRPLGSTSRTTTKPTRGMPHANNDSTTAPSRASSKNSNSTFGTSFDSVKNEKHSPLDGGDFLSPINFDDFHNSIMTREHNFSHFHGPGHSASGQEGRAPGLNTGGRWKANPSPQRERENRAPPVTRRPGKTSEHASSQHEPPAVSMPPPPAPPAQRTRRQSFVPPPSSTTVPGRSPRKSIGPGMLVADVTDNNTNTVKRKPSVSKKLQADENRPVPPASSNRASQPVHNHMGLLSAPRTHKARSLQPPARSFDDSLMPPASTPDTAGSSPNGDVHTPVKGNLGTVTPSSSSKRMSVMPAHATGLGARTISPTDARRMKRMSLIPQPPPLPRASPTQQDQSSPRPGSSVQSPSMIPRKSVTPSSSRTTPESHRKSYNSGASLSSNSSSNPARNSNGSLQNRLSQNLSSSRLPTPKPRNENTSTTEDEDVPPVPAIPKAYESPKTEPEALTFTSRKSSLPLELANYRRSSKEDPEPPSTGAVNVPDDDSQAAWSRVDTAGKSDTRHRSGVSISKKHLQPLKLPPLNLLPLGAPMDTKIDALRDKDLRASQHAHPESPLPRQTTQKTPSTPLTASKANFFSHNANEHVARPMTQTRSNSSIFTPRAVSTVFRSEHSSSALDTSVLHSERTVSPYVYSSLPKQPDWNHISTTPSFETPKASGSKLTGPRPQTQGSSFSPLPDTPKLRHVSYGAGPSADASSSPRRQASIEQKRSSARIHAALETNNDKTNNDSMPPPKLPASATWNNLTTTRRSPTSNLNYIHTRRRPSASNATNTAAPRHNQSISSEQNATIDSSPSTDSGETDNHSGFSASSVFPPVHKLGSRPGSSNKTGSQEGTLDKDDLYAEEEMRKMGSRRKDFESAAKELAELRRRASPKERATPAQALKVANLNIFEKGEIIDFKDIYFCGTHKAKKHVGDLNSKTGNFGYDDERGDYNIVIGDHIAYRYEIVDILGKGSFGQVVRCVDHKTGQLVAVKIIRNKKRFHQQALVEVNILQKLKEWDPDHRHSVVNFTQSFYFRGHLCISTELLGMNLYELIKAYDFKGFSTKIIRRFTKQMLSSLMLLQSHNVVHCDLKPENVLLVHPMQAGIKVIDFGSSCFSNEKVYTYIQSRFYRSPEVILGMSYGMPIDMWSLGCILAELYTGYPIFPGENEQEQLACIMEIFGPPEKHLIEKSTRKKLFFDSQGKPRLTVSSKGRRRKPSSKDLRHALKCDDDAFVDFIARCLRWDPARRLTPHDAMNHHFITGSKMGIRTRSHVASSSPGPKRNMSGSLTSVRPLPDPPSATLKPSGTRSGHSPVKAGASRRLSTVPNNVSGAPTKRATNAPASGGSALPRVSGRSTSGKPDLAAAAAATSLKTRV